jgi:archaellum component FlaD/FlaE
LEKEDAMDLTNRMTQLEDEIKVLKNEVLAVLLDVKENVLTRENPFTPQPQGGDGDRPVININQTLPSPEAMSRQQPERPASRPVSKQNTNRFPDETLETKENSCDETDNVEEPENYNDFFNRIVENDGQHPNITHDIRTRSSEYKPTPERPSQKKENIIKAQPKNGDQPAQLIDVATLLELTKWVENTAAQLGPENTMTILEVTEMIGKIPEGVNELLEKIVPRYGFKGGNATISSRTYLSCLRDLGRLLGQPNIGDFISVHVVTHGLNAITSGEKYG